MIAGTTINEGDVFIASGELAEFGVFIQPALDILSSILTMASASSKIQHYRM